ncbi:hypothetical protein [Pseudarthrobacter sp. BRE9]|jgi:hypothetical protein|uniref:hypothetical protein n=1 Tax=Pseudarthrobacter sp. BRE9 TaxID=2962582 RepID=UPI002881EE2C|nr:hypothetical protein [Pseudarthrobacter sp. BRE9]MDT0169140.1 hypothetical protein [Pseudarthrobacter sp. BRE9]
MHGLFVHEATLRFDADARTGAPGAAITTALCGSWEHPPPCPLAAHYTAVQQDGSTVTLRTIFAADPLQEGEVRRRIDDALAHGSQAGPDGTVSHWRFLESRAGELTTEERGHALRIAGS